MASTNINIRMDAELKQQFEEFCEDVGMSMTTAFNIFAKKVVRENRIPFEVNREVPNQDTREALAEVQCMKQDPSIGKSYHDVDAMMEDLLSDV